MNDRPAGVIMLTEVFNVVQRPNTAVGPSKAKRLKNGNMTFKSKIILADDGNKH